MGRRHAGGRRGRDTLIMIMSRRRLVPASDRRRLVPASDRRRLVGAPFQGPGG